MDYMYSDQKVSPAKIPTILTRGNPTTKVYQPKKNKDKTIYNSLK